MTSTASDEIKRTDRTVTAFLDEWVLRTKRRHAVGDSLDRLRAVMPWPERLTWSNFSDVFSQQPFGRWLLNSALEMELKPGLLGRLLGNRPIDGNQPM